MEEKERNHDEIFTNNLDIPYAEQCKTCRYRLKSSVKGDLCPPYKHTNCEVYEKKPTEIINNEKDCQFYKRENVK